LGNYFQGSSSDRPTNVSENSLLTETDTGDKYRLNNVGRWELIPPISHRSKRIQTLFIPFTDQTGLIFGQGTWQNINAELHSSGCMVYRARTSATSFGTIDDPGFMAVNDFALASMLPKIEMIFSFGDTGANSGVFIGLRDDNISVLLDPATLFADDQAFIGFGYRSGDTTYQIFHNDNAGPINTMDTGISRDTNVYVIEIEYEITTRVRLSLFDINKELIFETTIDTEIPPDGIDLGFDASIINANFTSRYAINMFDYIRLEKTKPPLSATLDP
jgi:hypothetical protein